MNQGWTHINGEILPYTFDVWDMRLAAELSLRSDFERDSGHFIC